MVVRFGTRELDRAFQKRAARVKLWGPEVGARFMVRIATLKAAKSIETLIAIPQLHLHPLSSDRAGQWSLTIVGRWRLIVTFNQPQTEVTVKEVSNHYGD